MSNLNDEPRPNGTGPAPAIDEGASPSSARPDFPKIGTPEWGEMNRKRAELIRKNIRGELTNEERELYEYLQSRSLAAVEEAFPHDGVDEERLTKLEKRLQGETSEG